MQISKPKRRLFGHGLGHIDKNIDDHWKVLSRDMSSQIQKMYLNQYRSLINFRNLNADFET